MDGRIISVVIADDHTLFRDGLARLLTSDPAFRIAGEAADGGTAVRMCVDLQPDVLLLDVMMPLEDGLSVLRRLPVEAPLVRCILVTAALPPAALVTALQLGARGVLFKDAAAPMLFESVRSVARDEYWLGGESVRHVIEATRAASAPQADPAAGTGPFGLTARELDVVAGVVAGETNKEIAVRLALREDTVKHYLSKIFDKAGVFSRLELAVFALNHAMLRDHAL